MQQKLSVQQASSDAKQQSESRYTESADVTAAPLVTNLQRMVGNRRTQQLIKQGRVQRHIKDVQNWARMQNKPTNAPVNVIQRFEARRHEQVERFGLTTTDDSGSTRGGFSDQEATATYFGNWQRDMSQAFSNNPLRAVLGDQLLFEILNLLVVQKFGRQLDEQSFGVYRPPEHMDNPAGQINSDLLTEQDVGHMGGAQTVINQEDISSPEAIAEMFRVTDDTFISIQEEVSNFLRGFDPFSANNDARSQATTLMLFKRYQNLATEDRIGPIVQPFINNFGTELSGRVGRKPLLIAG